MFLIIFGIIFIILIVAYLKEKDVKRKNTFRVIIRIFITICILILAFVIALILSIEKSKFNNLIMLLCKLIIPLFILPLWFKKKRKILIIILLIYTILSVIGYGINAYMVKYDESLRVKTDININVNEYMPFDDNSKIAKLNCESSLKLKTNLPTLDGAAAVFPVYSSFINAVYPSTVKYGEAPFYYNNTTTGYRKLANKEIDIFFGAYPSQEQIQYALKQETEFEYTKIGKEAFVFFVNKNNPVDSLSIEQIKGIYSGSITNWKEVGGNDEEIKAFQRNNGSGSQSMLIRFMGDTEIMQAPTEEINDFMMGIIDEVADYKNYSNSIGFSFRYYLESLVANPNVKMININGIKPSLSNITNDSYPIVTSLYAVTYKDNTNENVKKLINWILSNEGQELIEKTGYARVK